MKKIAGYHQLHGIREAVQVTTIASAESDGIIFTTEQRFSLLDDQDEHPLLCDRSNVVVIAAKYVFGFAKHMRDVLPTASFIGFTGTPIAQEDKRIRVVFGDQVSI